MTKLYVEGLDHLVDEGIYINRGSIVLEALRYQLGRYEIKPFFKERVKKPRHKASSCDKLTKDNLNVVNG